VEKLHSVRLNEKKKHAEVKKREEEHSPNILRMSIKEK